MVRSRRVEVGVGIGAVLRERLRDREGLYLIGNMIVRYFPFIIIIIMIDFQIIRYIEIRSSMKINFY